MLDALAKYSVILIACYVLGYSIGTVVVWSFILWGWLTWG